jgi:hypothetical protein
MVSPLNGVLLSLSHNVTVVNAEPFSLLANNATRERHNHTAVQPLDPLQRQTTLNFIAPLGLPDG